MITQICIIYNKMLLRSKHIISLVERLFCCGILDADLSGGQTVGVALGLAGDRGWGERRPQRATCVLRIS